MSYELALVLAAFGGFFIVLGAALVWQAAARPTGSHRAVRPPALAWPRSVVEEPAWCPECCTRTLHIRQPDGARTCGLCHHTTEGEL